MHQVEATKALEQMYTKNTKKQTQNAENNIIYNRESAGAYSRASLSMVSTPLSSSPNASKSRSTSMTSKGHSFGMVGRMIFE